MAALALKYNAPLVARARDAGCAGGVDERSWPALGVQDIVLDIPADNPAATLQHNTLMRKAALKSAFEPLGYPVINFVTGDDLPDLVADASTLICKYASILVLDTLAYQALLPLMMLRQNILHRPAEADPGRAEGLSHRRAGRELARCSSPRTSR